jgi:hypothetical protein
LLPLYEAINSIQAIEDAKEKVGKITIKLTRDTSVQVYESDGPESKSPGWAG